MIDRDAFTELGLRIDDSESDQELIDLVKEYFWFFRDFAFRHQQHTPVHNRRYL